MAQRLRLNNQFGTLGNSLASSTSGTSQAITNLFASAPGYPTFSSGYYAITIDPGTASEEIVWLTNFTSGGTNGTITRGQEGTSAPVHNSGASWVGAITALDFSDSTSTDITTAAFGDTASAGTTGLTPDAGHRHGMPASPLGLPLALTGATAATRYVGATTSGAPVSGAFLTGDFIIDQSGSVWVCTASGSQGTWQQVTPGVISITAGTNITITGPASTPTINATDSGVLVPTGYLAETFPRYPGVSSATQGPSTTGQLYCETIVLPNNLALTKLAVMIGSTAEAGGSHAWLALYDNTGAKLAVTGDTTGATALAANALFSGTISFTTTYAGYYYLCFCCVATTMPTFTGSAGNAALDGIAPIMVFLDGHTGLTTPSSAPANLTVAAGGAAGFFYGLVG